MIEKPYNGWSAHIRSIRGQRFYTLLRQKKLPPCEVCELCGNTKGMTYHAEEYGSTWEDYIASTHPLCCYCHVMMHVRARFPNRWARFVFRALEGELDGAQFPFETMGQAYGAFKGIQDISEEEVWTCISLKGEGHWLTKLPLNHESYDGPPKVALKRTVMGLLLPDWTIYDHKTVEVLEGVRYDAASQSLIPYKWSAASGSPDQSD